VPPPPVVVADRKVPGPPPSARQPGWRRRLTAYHPLTPSMDRDTPGSDFNRVLQAPAEHWPNCLGLTRHCSALGVARLCLPGGPSHSRRLDHRCHSRRRDSLLRRVGVSTLPLPTEPRIVADADPSRRSPLSEERQTLRTSVRVCDRGAVAEVVGGRVLSMTAAVGWRPQFPSVGGRDSLREGSRADGKNAAPSVNGRQSASCRTPGSREA
jgi:hypothetical protein